MYVDDKTIRLQLWDTAGQERFKSLIPSYVKDSTVAVVVYDITDKNTFESVKKWVEDAVSMRGDEVIIIIVGNKSDLSDHRKVTNDEGLKLASELNNAMFFETSAKDGTNVKTLFNELAKKLIGSDGEEEEEKQKRGIKLKDVKEDPEAPTGNGGTDGNVKGKCDC